VDEVYRERARSFGQVAAAYERARPGYPEDAVDWLVGSEPLRVLDLGAGTGKLTRQLVARGHRVTAVEPSREMLAQLRAEVPAAQAHEGSAEAIPLPDASVDSVVVAQAFHWFDAPVALLEIARVLGPGGRLGLVWNMRDDSVPWVARLSELIGAEQDSDDWLEKTIGASGLFGPVEERTFAHEQRVDRETLLDLVSSRSYLAVQQPPEREAILGSVGELYDEIADPEGLVVPYVTYAYRAPVRD
jgi:SAM-dependent methyltransferase